MVYLIYVLGCVVCIVNLLLTRICGVGMVLGMYISGMLFKHFSQEGFFLMSVSYTNCGYEKASILA